MFCQNCGNKISKRGKFCSKCGNKVNLDEVGEGIKLERNQVISNEESLIVHANNTANKMILTGILWIVAGAVLTGITYAIAAPGGTFFVFWGLSIYGIYRLIKGIYYRIFPQKLINEALKIPPKESSYTKIGWYDDVKDRFFCKDCFKKIPLSESKNYKFVAENDLNKDTYTCDDCGENF